MFFFQLSKFKIKLNRKWNMPLKKDMQDAISFAICSHYAGTENDEHD